MTLRTLAPLLLAIYAAVFLAPGFFTLPPIDRDEARFAQASKQMLESGDFVEIRFNDEARNKKPAGIYWAQALSAEIAGGPDAAIWAYRIPSAIGVLLAIVFTYAAGLALVGRRAAVLGAAMFAVSILLVTEGHLAKTDAMLCAAITAMQAGLARSFMRHHTESDANVRWADVLLIGIGLGASMLLKGPVGPMVAVLTVGGLWFLGGGLTWLRKTRFAVSIVIASAIVLPWAIAITLETGWTFWRDAILGDMLSKAVSAQETHGSPPGYYLLLVSVTLFPASLLLLPAIWRTMRWRSAPWAMFLIAWAVPTWLAFEIFPTKLPHYVLPTYPALALAIAAYACARQEGEPETAPLWSRILQMVLWGATVAVLAVLVIAAPDIYGGGTSLLDIAFATAVIAAAVTVLAVLLSETWRLVMPAMAVLSALTCAVVFQRTLPAARDMHISPRLAAAAHAAGYAPGSPIAATGYTEPSLVFLTATGIKLLPSGAHAARFVKENAGAFALVEKRQLKAFYDTLGEIGGRVDRVASLDGFNYSRGQTITVAIFRDRTPR
jgi:4-amino-4-deoxy-L-arabinose transferase-like glycosyltransferase